MQHSTRRRLSDLPLLSACNASYRAALKHLPRNVLCITKQQPSTAVAGTQSEQPLLLPQMSAHAGFPPNNLDLSLLTPPSCLRTQVQVGTPVGGAAAAAGDGAQIAARRRRRPGMAARHPSCLSGVSISRMERRHLLDLLPSSFSAALALCVDSKPACCCLSGDSAVAAAACPSCPQCCGLTEPRLMSTCNMQPAWCKPKVSCGRGNTCLLVGCTLHLQAQPTLHGQALAIVCVKQTKSPLLRKPHVRAGGLLLPASDSTGWAVSVWAQASHEAGTSDDTAAQLQCAWHQTSVADHESAACVRAFHPYHLLAQALAEACGAEDPAQRPIFAFVERELRALLADHLSGCLAPPEPFAAYSCRRSDPL